MCTEVFASSVANALGLGDQRKDPAYEEWQRAFDRLTVVPGSADVWIARRPRSWTEKADEAVLAGAELAFVDLFDFDVLGTREFRFYRVRFCRCPADRSLEGTDALVENDLARVLLVESGPAPGSL